MNSKVCVSALALLAMMGEGGLASAQTVQEDVITITATMAMVIATVTTIMVTAVERLTTADRWSGIKDAPYV